MVSPMAIRVPVIPPDVDPRPLIHHGRRGHNHRGWIHHGGRRGDDDGSRIDRHAYANGDPDSRVGGRRQGQSGNGQAYQKSTQPETAVRTWHTVPLLLSLLTLLWDSGVLCSTMVREAHLLIEGHCKRRASRRKGCQPLGWTTSAHPRPWNPTRAKPKTRRK